MNDRNDDQHVSTVDTARGVGHIIRIVVIIAVIAALVAVVLDNTTDVPVGYVFGDASAPIWIVIVASAVGGIIIGWLFTHRPRRND
ncbi:MAG: LapA family protein [Ilumatobacteraceae bacterium]